MPASHDPSSPAAQQTRRAVDYPARSRPRRVDVDAAEVADSTADDTRPEAAARVGARPKQLAGEHAKALLRDAGGILRAAVEAGLSGPLRSHDLFLRIGAVTPGE